MYSFWYNEPILLVTRSPVGSNIGALYQKLYIQSEVLLRMGELVAPKHVEQIQIDQ
jgi:hypothetical protein